MAVHRPAIVEEEQHLHRVPPLRPGLYVEIAVFGCGADRVVEIQLFLRPVAGARQTAKEARVSDKKHIITKPGEAGFSDEMRQKIRDLGTHRNGIILICGGPDSGTSTTALATLHTIDAYLYTLFALDGVLPEEKYTNVGIHVPNEEDDLATTFQRVKRKEADVLFVSQLDDEDVARTIYEFQDGLTFVCEIKAPHPAAAIKQMIDWLGEEAAAASIKCVITQKLIRKLCDECKEAYRPSPKILQRLGLPKSTKVLYREPSPPDEDDPEAMTVEELCAPCNGLPYHGRVALFELVEVTEGMKKVIEEGGDPSAIRAQVTEDDMQTLQKDGLRVVQEGKTSLEELQRAFRKPGGGGRRRRR